MSEIWLIVGRTPEFSLGKARGIRSVFNDRWGRGMIQASEVFSSFKLDARLILV